MTDKEMMRRVMEALPTMPIRAVVEPTQKKPQRGWQGLTNEEIDWLWGLAFEAKLNNIPRHFARMVEEKLKEKNT